MAKEVVRSLSRVIKLTYLQSLEILEGDRQPEDFLAVGMDFSGLKEIQPKTPRQRKRLDDILNTKFPSIQGLDSKNEKDTGWVMRGIHEEVDYSKVAYRIGIRELGLFSYKFAEVSQAVSAPISSPKPIAKVLLKTTEEIPAAFDPQRSWIIYEVTFDEGKTWHRINPQDKPSRFEDDGTIVPRVITVNTGPPTDTATKDVQVDTDVRTVRLRYTLRSDRTIDPDGLSSPVIRSVKLLVYPVVGLSGSDAEVAR